MKNLVRASIIIACFLAAIAYTGFMSWWITRKNTLKEIGLVAQDILKVCEKPQSVEDFANPYAFFLDDEKAAYIMSLCEDFNVDCDLVIAILMRENPTLKTNAVGSINQNGTVDLGLFQLNDRCLFQKGGFLDLFWATDFPEFDASNWKHNSYVAIRLIDSLTRTFGALAYENIAAAYNCGSGRVFSGEIPVSTASVYVPSVMNNLAAIKGLNL